MYKHDSGLSAYIYHREAFAEIDPDRYPEAYIDEMVVRGLWRCWGNEKAAILAEIKRFPSGLAEVHGVAAAGDLREIVGLIPQAEEWGRQCGCVRAVIESRPGWERMLPDYELHQVAVRKDL